MFKQAAFYGMNSGGEAGSGIGCVPYSHIGDNNYVACISEYTNLDWPLSFDDELRRNIGTFVSTTELYVDRAKEHCFLQSIRTGFIHRICQLRNPAMPMSLHGNKKFQE